MEQSRLEAFRDCFLFERETGSRGGLGVGAWGLGVQGSCSLFLKNIGFTLFCRLGLRFGVYCGFKVFCRGGLVGGLRLPRFCFSVCVLGLPSFWVKEFQFKSLASRVQGLGLHSGLEVQGFIFTSETSVEALRVYALGAYGVEFRMHLSLSFWVRFFTGASILRTMVLLFLHIYIYIISGLLEDPKVVGIVYR